MRFRHRTKGASMTAWRWFARQGLVLLFALATTGTAQAARELPVDDDTPVEEDNPTVKGVNVRFHARARRGLATRSLSGEREADRPGSAGRGDRDERNVQINDPALDHIQTFAGTRPFEFSLQSETSVAAS